MKMMEYISPAILFGPSYIGRVTDNYFNRIEGTGKTAIMRDKLAAMEADSTTTANINMNSLSDAPSLQLVLEQYLEKKSGD